MIFLEVEFVASWPTATIRARGLLEPGEDLPAIGQRVEASGYPFIVHNISKKRESHPVMDHDGTSIAYVYVYGQVEIELEGPLESPAAPGVTVTVTSTGAVLNPDPLPAAAPGEQTGRASDKAPSAEDPRMNAEKPLLDGTTVMARLGYKNRTAFWAFVRREGVPHVVLNARVIRFERGPLEDWLERRRSVKSRTMQPLVRLSEARDSVCRSL